MAGCQPAPVYTPMPQFWVIPIQKESSREQLRPRERGFVLYVTPKNRIAKPVSDLIETDRDKRTVGFLLALGQKLIHSS